MVRPTFTSGWRGWKRGGESGGRGPWDGLVVQRWRGERIPADVCYSGWSCSISQSSAPVSGPLNCSIDPGIAQALCEDLEHR